MAESTDRTTESESRSEHLFCPFCGTENSPDTEHCDHCGERVYAPDPERHQPSELATCAKCSTATFIRARYCVGCGVSLEAVKPTPYEPVPVDPSVREATYAPAAEPSSTPERQRNAADRWPLRDPRPPRAEGAVERPERVPRARAPLKEEPNDSGTKDARLPEQLRRFNWGAFFMGPVWGVTHQVWIATPLFIVWGLVLYTRPEVAFIYFAFTSLLAMRANELAWKRKKWPSIEHFRRVQRSWMLWGAVVWGFWLVGVMVIAGRPAAV